MKRFALGLILIMIASPCLAANLKKKVKQNRQRIEALEETTADHEDRLTTEENISTDHETRLQAVENTPPAARGIKVFDGGDQFVGLLVGIFPTGYTTHDGSKPQHYTVFLPSLGKFTMFRAHGTRLWDPDTLSRQNIKTIYYATTDCTGQAYLVERNDQLNIGLVVRIDMLYYDKREAGYRVYKVGEVQEPDFPLQSIQEWDSDTCLPVVVDTSPVPLTYLPLHQVTPPFELPLEGPIRFE